MNGGKNPDSHWQFGYIHCIVCTAIPFNCILDVHFRLRLPISSILCSIIWFLNIYLRIFFVFSKLLKLLKKTVTERINTHKKFKILLKNAQNKIFSNCLDPNLVFLLFTENSQHNEEFTKRFFLGKRPQFEGKRDGNRENGH